MSNEAEKTFAAHLEQYLERLTENAWAMFEDAQAQCESPIERKLLAAMMFMDNGWGCYARLPNVVDALSHSAEVSLRISPQTVVGPYRVDFALELEINRSWLPIGGKVLIAVECDGHDFHEKTKEQAARDKARDRYLAKRGYTVLRFTGSEIHRNASACCDQISAVLSGQIQDRIDAYCAARNEQEAQRAEPAS